jgi:hypothetical protein
VAGEDAMRRSDPSGPNSPTAAGEGLGTPIADGALMSLATAFDQKLIDKRNRHGPWPMAAEPV